MSKVLFGTATASFQIEGGGKEGGRTPCIWDTFCDTPGKVLNMDNGLVACDHYHKYKEDIALMKELGVESYRFSIAWPRIFPAKGQYNPEGMQFYKNVITELENQGIAPAVTLYHWDLPQWAQDLGGWENRDSADWYLEYAAKCFAELGDRVAMWITHNEPWCASFLSNFEGQHAPGNTDLEKALRVAHHLLLSHGKTVEHYRKTGLKAPIGITLNPSMVYPASDSYADKLACTLKDGYSSRWFYEPLFKGRYPDDAAALFAARCGTAYEFVQQGDLELISLPIDFLGVNYYTHSIVEFSPGDYLLSKAAYTDLPRTAMGWDVIPQALYDLVAVIRRDYTDIPVYITENGAAYPDTLEGDAVHDADRVDYLNQHLAMVEKMNANGLNVAGYYYWSFMDNFEWAFGYSRRFGLVYIDYENGQKRIPKDSFYAYQKYIAAHK